MRRKEEAEKDARFIKLFPHVVPSSLSHVFSHVKNQIENSESLTLAIARAGRRVYVYLPFGPLGEVLPYLLRRALENSQMLSGGEKGKPTELDAVRRELKARAVGVFLPRDK